MNTKTSYVIQIFDEGWIDFLKFKKKLTKAQLIGWKKVIKVRELRLVEREITISERIIRTLL